MLVVHGLARILLHMQAGDADPLGHLAVGLNIHIAARNDRVLVLADLIALGQVGVKIVLPVKARIVVHLPVDAEPGLHRLLDATLVQHRQHARKGRVNQADMAVRLLAERGRRAGKQLGVGDDLRVHLEPDHHLPLAALALQALWFF